MTVIQERDIEIREFQLEVSDVKKVIQDNGRITVEKRHYLQWLVREGDLCAKVRMMRRRQKHVAER